MNGTAAALTNHTVVIPTYNRPEFVSRLVTYYRDVAPQLPLVVLDSSRDEIVAANKRSLCRFGDAVRHRVFPSTMPVIDKLAAGVAEVATPYVSLCADDDIVFPAALREAVRFLAGNPDYVSAHGLYLNFRVAGHQVHITREYSGSGNEAASAARRIFTLCQHYESLYYAVFRTADLQHVMTGATALPTLHFQELFQSVAALIRGKVKRFPSFYGGRQSCDPAEPERDKWQTYYWFADNAAEMLADYAAYRDQTWRFYREYGPTSDLDEEGFLRVLDLAHAVYFSAGCPPQYFLRRLAPYWPDEPDVSPQHDLLQDLRPASPDRAIGRTVAFVNRVRRQWRRRVRARWTAARDELDHAIQHSAKAPWACRLPSELEWLATLPEFRGAFGELCRYLDHS